MKQVFTTLATVLGFFSIASAVLFSVMSPSQAPVTGGGALTADISANFSGSADVPTTTPSQVQSPDQRAPDEIAYTNANATATPQMGIPTPPAPSEAVSPPTRNDPILPGGNPGNTPAAPPAASTTITVTPTAPAPPTLFSSSPAATPQQPATQPLPYHESDFSGDNNWQTTWGISGITSAGYLRLSAGANSFGTAAYLKNGAGWANYTMSSTLSLTGGATFGLMADYVDSSNYVLCEYARAGTSAFIMQLAQYTKGYKIALSPSVEIPWDEGAMDDIHASIAVSGAYGTCSLGDRTVSNEGAGAGRSAMSNPGSGSVGFVANDPLPNTSQIIVKYVTVSGE